MFSIFLEFPLLFINLARFGKPGGAGAESFTNKAVAQTTLRNYLLLVGDSE